MLIGNRYHFHRATLAVREGSERRLLQVIPVGSVVTVSSLSEDGRFMGVHWGGVTLMLFTQDFVERARAVEILPIPGEPFLAANPFVN